MLKGRSSAQIEPLFLFAGLVLAVLNPLSALDRCSTVDEYMNGQMKANGFSGSVLIAQDGKVLIAKGYGMADVELNVPNTPDTKFRLASITQQFTAMAILELEEDGRLSTEDPVCKYILKCPNDWQGIKIVDLLTHTSGIPNFTDFPDYEKTSMLPTTVPELLARFENKPLEFKPGEKLKYSGSGYEVTAPALCIPRSTTSTDGIAHSTAKNLSPRNLSTGCLHPTGMVMALGGRL